MCSLASLRATLHFILQYIASCRDVSFPLALTPPHLPFGTPLNLIAIVRHLVCNQMFLYASNFSVVLAPPCLLVS